MGQIQRLGILTSGGDCPGLNAVIRAVVHHATLTYGWEVLGLAYATQGLLERKATPLTLHGMDLRGIDPLLSMGGTILGSINRGKTEDLAEQICAGYRELGLDALIGVGGDGSLAILDHLAQRGGWQLIGVPKTIDNDVALTERAIGFDTAVNTVVDAINRLTYTAASHDRVMVVEVMGRTAGHLALHAGIAGGADVILIPEIPYSVSDLCRHIEQLRERWNRRFAIVVVAEGARTQLGDELYRLESSGQKRLGGIGEYIVESINRCSGDTLEARATVLGHVQRGGIPSALDRLTATVMGKTAVDLVAQGQSSKMVAWQSGRAVPVPLKQVCEQSPMLVHTNNQLVDTARGLGIYIGQPTEVTPLGPACFRPQAIPQIAANLL